MRIKQILCLLVAIAVISPVMAKEKKAKPAKGKFVSITEEKLVVKVKKDEKTYTITEETKILNKDGEEVAVADVKFKMVELTMDPEDAAAVIKIKELAKKAKGDKKKKKKTEE